MSSTNTSFVVKLFCTFCVLSDLVYYSICKKLKFRKKLFESLKESCNSYTKILLACKNKPDSRSNHKVRMFASKANKQFCFWATFGLYWYSLVLKTRFVRKFCSYILKTLRFHVWFSISLPLNFRNFWLSSTLILFHWSISIRGLGVKSIFCIDLCVLTA